MEMTKPKYVLAALTLAINAVMTGCGFDESRFISRSGALITRVPRVTIIGTDESSIRIHWTTHHTAHYATLITTSHEATVYLTSNTVYSGGTKADVVKGRQVRITYHFENGHAIADTIRFVEAKK
jgi:hypothetical protein